MTKKKPASEIRNERHDPKDRRDAILTAALSVAEKHRYDRMTRDQVAAAAGCSPGLVTHYWKTMQQLRRAVMRAAVRDGRAAIVAQGIGAGNAHAQKAPPKLKTAAIALLAAA